MAVGLVSLLTRIPARSDLAITGEISLRGRLLPIGGLREKILAAVRAGLKRVIIPSRNVDDLELVPVDLRNQIEILMAEHVEQVLDWALLKSPFEADSAPRRTWAATSAANGRAPAPSGEA